MDANARAAQDIWKLWCRVWTAEAELEQEREKTAALERLLQVAREPEPVSDQLA